MSEQERRWKRWARRLLRAAAALVVLVVVVMVAGYLWMREELGARPDEHARASFASSEHFDVERGAFFNVLPRVQHFSFGDLLEFLSESDTQTTPATPPEVIAPRFSAEAPEGLAVTWINHSTVLIEIDGARFLTDPVWSKGVGPADIVSRPRFYEPPLELDALPPVDAVIISHDHYDHLDRQSVRALSAEGARFLVPLGVGSHLRFWGVPEQQITELDWWQERTIKGVRVVATPARHFSGRSVDDADATLWASWSFVGPGHRVFFSGDTALSRDFETIGERLGPFDLTMMEVGAYDQRWPDVHLGPEQALKAHAMVGGDILLPIHWGTFNLAMHSWVEPMERMLQGAREANVRLVTPRPGQTINASAPPAPQRWWPADVAWRPASAYPVESTGL